MALMFGVMAPIAAAVTRRFDARVTLLAGAVEICLAYVARNLISPSLAQIVCGSVLVAAGTSMTYAALPTLIMSAVPVTQTASANGLNTLGRAIGQSTASATLAAVLTLGLHVIGGRLLPSYAALQTMLWLAAAVAAGAALVTLPLFRLSRGVPPAGVAVVAVIDGVGDTATAFTALPDDVPDGPADRPRATQLSPPPRG
jgi:cyanate permease